MLRLRAELAILAASSHFRGHDGAKSYLAPDKADANLVGPVKQIVQIIPGHGRENFCIAAIQQLTRQHPARHPCNARVHHASIPLATSYPRMHHSSAAPPWAEASASCYPRGTRQTSHCACRRCTGRHWHCSTGTCTSCNRDPSPTLPHASAYSQTRTPETKPPR